MANLKKTVQQVTKKAGQTISKATKTATNAVKKTVNNIKKDPVQGTADIAKKIAGGVDDAIASAVTSFVDSSSLKNTKIGTTTKLAAYLASNSPKDTFVNAGIDSAAKLANAVIQKKSPDVIGTCVSELRKNVKGDVSQGVKLVKAAFNAFKS